LSAVPGGAIAAGLAAAASASGRRINVTVAGTSMLPGLRPGDILMARPLQVPGVREGDIVLFRSRLGLCAHRVIAIRGGALVTRGDAAPADDGLLPLSDILGVVETVRRGGIQFAPRRHPTLLQRAAAALLRRSSLLRNAAGKLIRAAASQRKK
jgi:signal peptidase I